MGQLDDVFGPRYFRVSSDSEFDGFHDNPRVGEGISSGPRTHTPLDVLDDAIGQITSRDDIINPYDIVDIRNYPDTPEGRAQYQQDLARAIEYQKQQLASYEEWYSSESQQAIRMSEAGLNAALHGLSGTQAAQTEPSSMIPAQDIPTSEERTLSKISAGASFLGTVINGLSAVTGLASAFSQIGLNKVAKEGQQLSNIGQGLSNVGQELSNISALKSLIASDIDNSLGTAMQSALESGVAFDLDSWFSDDSNFETLRNSYGTFSGFDAALSQARKSVLAHRKNAVGQQKDFAISQDAFAKIASSPFYSFEQKLHLAQLQPYMVRLERLEESKRSLEDAVVAYQTAYHKGLDPDAAVDAANSQNRYNHEYYSEADGKLVAAFEQFMRECETSGKTMQKEINDNYLSMYRANKDNIDGWKAAYLFSSNGGSSWQEAYMVNSTDYFLNFMKSNETVQNAIAKNAELREKIASFGALLSKPTRLDSWELNSVGWSLYRKEMLQFIDSLTKIADGVAE